MLIEIKCYATTIEADVKTFRVYDTGFNSTAIAYIVDDIESEVERVNNAVNGIIAHSHNGYVVLKCTSVSPVTN